MRTVVLVEGESDRIAVETLTTRSFGTRPDLEVVAMGGATNVRMFARRATAARRILGLCDAGEAWLFERAGIGPPDLFVCDADLEDELIRSLGSDAVIAIVEVDGRLRSFQTLQHQPAQRGRAVEAKLRRFIGARSGLKLRFARLLTDMAIDEERVPDPLRSLLDRLAVTS